MTVAQLYDRYYTDGRWATDYHLPILWRYAAGCDLAVEFGCRHGRSATALLRGAKRVISYDIKETPEARELERIAEGRFELRVEDSLTADIPECDLIFFDSLHTFAQLSDELAFHAHKARKFLIFHDVITFGTIGADGESGRCSWTHAPGKSVPIDHLGIRPAIDRYMIEHREWMIEWSDWISHGLLVLKRCPSS